MLSMVLGFFFLANTTGSFIRYPVMMAGAIPLASIVRILFAPLPRNLLTNSPAMAPISTGSI